MVPHVGSIGRGVGGKAVWDDQKVILICSIFLLSYFFIEGYKLPPNYKTSIIISRITLGSSS